MEWFIPQKLNAVLEGKSFGQIVVMEKAFAQFYVSLQRVVVDERRSTR